AAVSAVNGGATTISQCAALAVSGLKDSKNACVSAWVLNIFQFPAITGRRNAFSFITYLLVRKRFNAGKFFASQEFKRSAPARRDVRYLRSNTSLLHGSDRIPSADTRSGACLGCLGNSARDSECPLGERRPFKHAQRAVPNNRSCYGNFRAEFLDSFRADVEAHPAIRSFGHLSDLRDRGVGRLGEHVIHRQAQPELAGARPVPYSPSGTGVFVFHPPPPPPRTLRV